MQQREVTYTADGSATVLVKGSGVSFHSINGAITESMHVFINAGFKYWLSQHSTQNRCCIFEMGFGTGLNALLTAQQAAETEHLIYYETVELYPLEEALVIQLNYIEQLHQPELVEIFRQLHHNPWDKETAITPSFTFKKNNVSLTDFSTTQLFNIIYFDAFDPNEQPELWKENIFHKLYSMLTTGGILVTYSSKGAVRRAMQSAGFQVEKLPGPPGKREIVRAIK